MTVEQKYEILRMKNSGQSITQIADALGISRNTVKSYCQRHSSKDVPTRTCAQCGAPLVMIPGKKEKRFCSEGCRSKYWNAHLQSSSRNTLTEYTCPTCGKPFVAYANRDRKYCSHTCYVEARFGGAGCR